MNMFWYSLVSPGFPTTATFLSPDSFSLFCWWSRRKNMRLNRRRRKARVTITIIIMVLRDGGKRFSSSKDLEDFNGAACGEP